MPRHAAALEFLVNCCEEATSRSAISKNKILRAHSDWVTRIPHQQAPCYLGGKLEGHIF